MTLGIGSFVAQAVTPFAVGRALDSGLQNGLSRELLGWAGLMLGAALVQVTASGFGHRFDVLSWLRAGLTTTRLLGRTVNHTGDAIHQELPAGEVVSSVASDAHRLGHLYFQFAYFMGSVVTYAVVGVVLFQTSPKLGILVALGLPLVAAVLAFLVKPLANRQEKQREEQGRLNSLGSDTVSGLRILRGIGGEDVFVSRYKEQSAKVRATGVSVAGVQSTMDSLQVLLPGIFVAIVLWVGAREAVAGNITTGEMVTFYGYATFLTWPMQNLIQTVQVAIRANVGAKKVLRILGVTTRTPDTGPLTEVPRGTDLVDETSGATLPWGALSALVGPDPDVCAAVATRFARFDDAIEKDTPVHLDGHLLKEFTHTALRQAIVLSDATPHIFAGTLRDTLRTTGEPTDCDLFAALEIADAHDVLDSLDHSLDTELPEKGRSLSGGQRQRVSLARAVATEAERLILIEPTSAVDAHTESRIATRLCAHRRGRATLFVTASPLMLEHMEIVQVLGRDSTVIGTGTHLELLNDATVVGQTYRAVVGREMAQEASVCVPLGTDSL